MKMNRSITFLLLSAVTISVTSCVMKSPPAPPPEAALEPIETETRSDGTHRTFALQAGDQFALLRATGVLTVVSISTNGITLDRGGPTQFVVNTNGKYHVGNHEYLTVNTIDAEQRQAEVDIHTRKLHPVRDALSF